MSEKGEYENHPWHIQRDKDEESQLKRKINGVEELILKPLYEGIYNLTEAEINSYLQLQVGELKETKLNMKTIIIFEQTKKFIEENKDEILKKIREKHKKEESGYER